MAATIRLTCTHSAPMGWEWANHINKGFRHPTASINGEERELKWDAPTDIPVPVGDHTSCKYSSNSSGCTGVPPKSRSARSRTARRKPTSTVSTSRISG